MKLGDKSVLKALKVLKFIALILFSSLASANSCVVLLYHHFSDVTPKSTSVSPKLFEQHLQYLQVNGFEVLSLKTMLERLGGNSLPNKCVVLTADDAYQSIAENAYPLLQKYQMSMSVFVATDSIDHKYKAMMTWQKMRDIQGKTMAFYSHGTSHAHFLDLNKVQIQAQIQQSQNRLNQELGKIDKVFAYPYGEASLDILKQIKDMGYIAFGQYSGVVSPMSNKQSLPRFPMAASFAEMPSFKTKVNALAMPVKAKKINPIFTQNPPKLTLEFTQVPSQHQIINFNCFASDGVNVIWQGNKKVEVIAKKPLSSRRNKYNCTMPSKQKGRHYWHSIQWINPKIAE